MKYVKSTTISKIIDRCNVLADLLNAVRPIYICANFGQKALIETTIGAAIWYIPKMDESFSGLISRKVIKSFRDKNPQISEEHIYPRKVSAKELLNMGKISGDQMLHLYRTKYCKICLITPSENKQAIQFQKVNAFSSPGVVYKKAGIELVNITKDELKALKKGNPQVLNLLEHRENALQLL
ncbi:hypothetical protein K1X84_16615 [bacterium]|nr:hypothetical protein [bacterium]